MQNTFHCSNSKIAHRSVISSQRLASVVSFVFKFRASATHRGLYSCQKEKHRNLLEASLRDSVLKVQWSGPHISFTARDSQAAGRTHFSGFLQLLKLRVMCMYGVLWGGEAIKNALINTFEGKLCSLLSRFWSQNSLLRQKSTFTANQRYDRDREIWILNFSKTITIINSNEENLSSSSFNVSLL